MKIAAVTFTLLASVALLAYGAPHVDSPTNEEFKPLDAIVKLFKYYKAHRAPQVDSPTIEGFKSSDAIVKLLKYYKAHTLGAPQVDSPTNEGFESSDAIVKLFKTVLDDDKSDLINALVEHKYNIEGDFGTWLQDLFNRIFGK